MKRLRIARFGSRLGEPAIFAVTLALGLVALPLPSNGQQPAKVYRIGFIGNTTSAVLAPADRTGQNCPTKGSPYWQALVEGLRERGYVQGQNLIIECRYTEGHPERAPALAAELVSLKVDLMVAYSTANVRAAKQATATLPIVMAGVIDPVGRGLVASLAQPGGNVTGPTEDAGTPIVGKMLQVLKEVVPTATRVAVLGDLSNSPFGTPAEAAARALGVRLQSYAVPGPEQLDDAFAAIAKARPEALLVLSSPYAWTHAQRIVDFATQSQLPAVYPGRAHVEAGGLMSYALHDLPGVWRRIGVYVDKIFNGAKPGDLPVEQPSKFELVINLKTAKALGLTIPQSLLLQADEAIQ